MAERAIPIVVLLLAFLRCASGEGFSDNTTIWLNGSNTLMYFAATRDWLAGTTVPQQPSIIPFADVRKTMESVSAHYAWHYSVISERGTRTLAVFQRTTNVAVYAHVGTSPLVGHVTVDWLSNNFYWTDSGFGWIGMQALKKNIGTMSTNGASLRVVVSTSLDSPYGVTVLPNIQRLFWSDHGSPPKLESSNLLGEDRRVLVWQGLFKPTAVSADHTTNQLYWVDEVKGTVESINKDGTGRRIVIFIEQSSLTGLKVFQEYIIVSERRQNQLQVYNKDTGKIAATSFSDAYHPGDVTVFSSALQPRVNVTCDMMSCDHMCIHGEPSHCVCASGYTLSDDGSTCTESQTALWKSFLISTTTKICAIPINLLFSHPYLPADHINSKILCFVNNSDIRHFAVDSRNSSLYYVARRAVHRYRIQNGNDEVLYTASSDISGLAYDWIREMLLWSHQGPDNKIYTLAQNHTQPMVIYSSLDNPAYLTMDSHRGSVFWVEQKATGGHQIWSGTVAGNTPKVAVLTSDLTRPKNLVYDYKTDRLYWLDVDNVGSIERDGKNKHIFSLGSIPRYSGLTIFRGFVVWSATASSSSTNMTFRNVNLIENDDVVTFALPAKIQDVTDLSIYEANGNIDIRDTCEVDNGGCSQLCLVNGAAQRCHCYFGFQLDNDGVTCTSEYVSSEFFLVTDKLSHQLYQISGPDHLHVSTTQIQEAAHPNLSVFNSGTGEIIWFDSYAAAIKLSSLNGTTIRLVKLLHELGQPQPNTVGAMGIDQSTSNLFFTEIMLDSSKGWIRVISLNTLVMKTLYESDTPPRYLAIAPQKGIIVFGTESGTIYQSEMSMEKMPTQLTTNISALSGLALSHDGTVVEWSDKQVDEIWQMPLSTLTPEIRLQRSGSHPHALQAWGSSLYYLTASGRTIKSLSVSGTESTVAEFPQFGRLTSLHFFGDGAPEVTTACSERNGRCSTLCLPTPSGRQCQCADGVEVLDDKKTCSDVERCSEEVRNGQLAATCDRYPAEICTYTCDEGFRPNPDTAHIQCSTSGHWNVTTDGLCLVTCPQVLANHNGHADDSCHRVAGQTCALMCNEGYTAAGGVLLEITCGEDGQWKVQGECQAEDTTSESLPIYAIGVISAGGVAIVAVIVGCFLYRRMKRFGGRDSCHKGPGDLPTVLFISDHGSGASPPKQVEDDAGSNVYDELQDVTQEVHYTSFSKVSPCPQRRPAGPAGWDNPGLILHDDMAHPSDLNGGGNVASSDYIETVPDYLTPIPTCAHDNDHHYSRKFSSEDGKLPPNPMPPRKALATTNPGYVDMSKPAGNSSKGGYLTPHLPPPQAHRVRGQSAAEVTMPGYTAAYSRAMVLLDVPPSPPTPLTTTLGGTQRPIS